MNEYLGLLSEKRYGDGQPQELLDKAVQQTKATMTSTFHLKLDGMTVGSLIGARQRVKAQLEREEADYGNKIAPLKEAMQKLEGAIVDKMDAERLDNVKTPYGTAYFTNPESMRVTNRDAFMDWVIDNNAYDVLTSAVSRDAIRARGVIPPGVETSTIRKLCIRKPT